MPLIDPQELTRLTDDLVLRFVAAKLKGMRVVSVGTSPSDAGEDIIIRLQDPPTVEGFSAQVVNARAVLQEKIDRLIDAQREANARRSEIAPETAQNGRRGE